MLRAFTCFVGFVAALVLSACGGPASRDAWTTPYLPTDSRVSQESSHRDDGPDWFDLLPGETMDLGLLDGPGIIRRFWIAVGTANEPLFTRKLVLRAYWDNETNPSVEVPLGDFFGSGFGINPSVESAFFTQSTGGFTSFWPMPFRRAARVTLTNESEATLAIYYQLTWTRERDLPSDTQYFHAQWTQHRPAMQGENMVLLDALGRGRLAGLSLNIQGAYRGREHYLEGDELIYIDGAAEPTLAGTGHEDLFNNAWYFNGGVHTRPTHGVVVVDPERSRYAAYRMFLNEDIQFQRELRFELEHAEAYNSEKADYASTVYWYQSEPHIAFPPMAPMSARLPREPKELFRIPNVIEAEDTVPGFTYRMTTYHEEVSQFRAMLLSNDLLDPDHRFTFEVDSPTTSSVEVSLLALEHATGGTWAVELNGERLGNPVDTWAEKELTTSLTSDNRAIPPVRFEKATARAGANQISLVQTGINPRAVDRVFFGGRDQAITIERGALLLDAIGWKLSSAMQVLEAEDMATDPSGFRIPSVGAHGAAALWFRFSPDTTVSVPFRVDRPGTWRLTAWFAGASRPTELSWQLEGMPQSDTILSVPGIRDANPNTAHDLGTYDLGRGEFTLIFSAPSLDGKRHVEVALDALVLERLDGAAP